MCNEHKLRISANQCVATQKAPLRCPIMIDEFSAKNWRFLMFTDDIYKLIWGGSKFELDLNSFIAKNSLKIETLRYELIHLTTATIQKHSKNSHRSVKFFYRYHFSCISSCWFWSFKIKFQCRLGTYCWTNSQWVNKQINKRGILIAARTNLCISQHVQWTISVRKLKLVFISNARVQ